MLGKTMSGLYVDNQFIKMPLIPGWLTKLEEKELYNITKGFNRPETIGVEVGSLHGRSSYIISTAINLGKLYCVDRWTGWCTYNSNYSDEQITKGNYPNKDNYNTLEFFLENVKEKTNIITIKGTSPECVQDWDTMIDFIFLDASHENPSDLDNIKFWLPKLKPGGMFIGHDSHFKDVAENIKYLEDLLNQSVTIIPKTSIWYFSIPLLK